MKSISNDDTAPRILPLLPDAWDDPVFDALTAFPAGRDFVLSHWRAGQSGVRGLNAMGTLVRHPVLAKAFLTFNAHVASTSTLSARDRELAILRMSWLWHSEYEWVQHVIMARKAGMTDAELERIPLGPDATGWDSSDADLLRAVDELRADACISNATWARLAERFDTQQLMDLIFVIGCYQILAMALNSFGTPLEPGVEPLDATQRARLKESSCHSS